MTQKETDEKYMRRCLQLAANGRQNAKPNPMVGAVIVSEDGRIIGEGYHARCGEGHAEVNAFASVRAEDESLLKNATIYVSLEPCSHYGKTPPCADLIIKKKVRRCVCGCVDPFDKVQGRGIKKIKQAGIEVSVGVLEKECLDINRRFITFNTFKRPYIILKWCQTSNGFLDDNCSPVILSNSFTRMLCHKLRSEYDAILVGRVTDERDNPQLTTRYWSGRNPEKVVLKSSAKISDVLQRLYEDDKQSLIVEGGAKTLNSFITEGFWDEIRVETATNVTVAGGTKAPIVPECAKVARYEEYDGNTIVLYRNINNK